MTRGRSSLPPTDSPSASAGASSAVSAGAGGLPPVAVLLHGQPGDRHQWDLVVEAVDERARLLVPDRPGYGASDGPAVGIGENADRVVACLSAEGISQAVIVGHSYAGAIALDVALRYPERVAGLVLLGSIGGRGSVGFMDRVLALPVAGPVVTDVGLAMLSVNRLPRLGRLVATALAPRDPGAVDGIRGSWLRSRRSFTIEQRSMMEELPTISAGLGAITAPAIVVAGDLDRVVSPASQRALADALPNGILVRVSGVGHLVPLEAPELVAEAILSWR